MSYSGDRLGHGLNPTSSDGEREHERMPSSRTEAIATAARLRRQVEAWGGNKGDGANADASSVDEVQQEVPLWDAALTEVVRQVSVHCQERGQLLEAIRQRHAHLFDYLLNEQEARIAELQKQHEDTLKTAVEKQPIGQGALLFRRGRQRTPREGGGCTGGVQCRGNDKVTIDAAADMAQLQAKESLLKAQLVEARQQLQEATRKLNDPKGQRAVLNALRKLPEKDQQSIGAKLLREDSYTRRYYSPTTTEGRHRQDAPRASYRRVARHQSRGPRRTDLSRGAHAGSEVASSGPRSVGCCPVA